jgi:phage gp45-like
MTDMIKELSAKLRNLFVIGDFQKRCDDGRIRVKTHNNIVVEKREAFPYGFYAKAKSGRAFVFCQGGNFDGFEIFPVQPGDDITPPELEEGDTALYTGGGGWIVLREAGGVEINSKASGNITLIGENGNIELFGTDAGGVVKAKELKTQLDKLTARVDGIMDALKNSATAAQDGGATYKGQIVAMLATLVDKENFSNIESEKVLHGTG